MPAPPATKGRAGRGRPTLSRANEHLLHGGNGWVGVMTKACPGFLPVTEKRHGCLTPKEGAPDVSVRKAAALRLGATPCPTAGSRGVSRGTAGTGPREGSFLPLQACEGRAELCTVLVPQKLNTSEAQRKIFQGKSKALCG